MSQENQDLFLENERLKKNLQNLMGLERSRVMGVEKSRGGMTPNSKVLNEMNFLCELNNQMDQS